MNTYPWNKTRHFFVKSRKKLYSTNNLKYFLSSSGLRRALMNIGRASSIVYRFSSLRSSMVDCILSSSWGELLRLHHLYHQCLNVLHCYVIGLLYQVWIFPLTSYEDCDGFIFLLLSFSMKMVADNNCASFHLQLTISGDCQYILFVYTWWENTIDLFVISYITKILGFMIQQSHCW